MSEIVIRENCIFPTTSHHRKKIGRGRGGVPILRDADTLTSAIEFWMALLLPHRIPEPLAGPVELTIEYRFAYRATERKKQRESPQWMTSRPDGSNLRKTLEDVLVKLRFFNDDSQVVDGGTRKIRCDCPGVSIRIRDLSEVSCLPLL